MDCVMLVSWTKHPVVKSPMALVVTVCLMLSAPLSAQGQGKPKEHPLMPAIKMAKESHAALARIADYECEFTRREFVKNRLVTQRTTLRLRHKPFSVYMKFIDPAPGREVLYVAGKNRGMLLAHEASGLSSLIGTISLSVNSPKVMAETRHPITQAGMQRLIQLVVSQWERESKFGETDVKFYPNAKMSGSDCEVIEVSHPRPRKQFPYQLTRVFFDKKTRLPIRVENYGFPAAPGRQSPLIEEYTYSNIKVNNGFKDSDFDKQNPKYSF